MGKHFNTTGICYPEDHYMVDMEERLEKIAAMVDNGEYFTINRARQYGKTTTLNLLAERLAGSYIVFSISFEGMGKNAYASETLFCRSLCKLLYRKFLYGEAEGLPADIGRKLNKLRESGLDMIDLSDFLSEACSQASRPVVLMIDEVDQAASQEIFLTFLGMLRDKYLKRKKQPAFQSVILASVCDIKNLKLKIRPDDAHQYNSPWNISCDFTVEMDFSVSDIAGMLEAYEQDHHTGMDTAAMAELLYDYTSGYPFLTSRLCKIMDEGCPGLSDKKAAWSRQGVLEAVKILLSESNTLFDDMVKKLSDFPELKEMLSAILFRGEKIPYNSDSHAIQTGVLFGFLRNSENNAVISNRIFETRLYNLFLSEEVMNFVLYKAASLDKNRFIINGELNMELILEKFMETFSDIYADADEAFLEENGRRFFLLYLKPIINGVGNYYTADRQDLQ